MFVNVGLTSRTNVKTTFIQRLVSAGLAVVSMLDHRLRRWPNIETTIVNSLGPIAWLSRLLTRLRQVQRPTRRSRQHQSPVTVTSTQCRNPATPEDNLP